MKKHLLTTILSALSLFIFSNGALAQTQTKGIEPNNIERKEWRYEAKIDGYTVKVRQANFFKPGTQDKLWSESHVDIQSDTERWDGMTGIDQDGDGIYDIVLIEQKGLKGTHKFLRLPDGTIEVNTCYMCKGEVRPLTAEPLSDVYKKALDRLTTVRPKAESQDNMVEFTKKVFHNPRL